MTRLANGHNGNGTPKPSRLTLWRAERKLAMARAALAANRGAWAWFAAHEAAELAARALCGARNGSTRERMVSLLLLRAAQHVEVPGDLIHRAAILDSHYIPVQNGHSLNAPDRTAEPRRTIVSFGNPDAPPSDIAVDVAEEVVRFARAFA